MIKEGSKKRTDEKSTFLEKSCGDGLEAKSLEAF